MFRANISLFLSLVLFSSFGFSQSIKGGQFDFGFSNGLNKEWYFNQTVKIKPFTVNSKPFSSDTLFLDKDLNSDRIPDMNWFIKFNSWRWRENVDDNNNDIAVLTVPFTAKNGKVYDGSDIEIYQQFPNTIQIISDLATFSTKPIDGVNVFYRFSKVIPQNTSVRSATSQPLLIQAPANFRDIKSRTAIVQVLFITKIAYYKSCDCSQKSDYFYYPCDKRDFSKAFKNNWSWIVFDENCDSESQVQEYSAKSCLINWGNEKTFSKVIVEIVLKW